MSRVKDFVCLLFNRHMVSSILWHYTTWNMLALSDFKAMQDIMQQFEKLWSL